jgi:mRNA-degrading endonuclease RelE of RelBE toxin-antitoxin system
MFTFVESRLFTRLVQECLSDDEYAAVQRELIADPDAGSVIPGSKGLRKLRVAVPGRGKRGGSRLIYFVRRPKQLIWMLTIYPNNVAASIPAHVLRKIREEIEDD